MLFLVVVIVMVFLIAVSCDVPPSFLCCFSVLLCLFVIVLFVRVLLLMLMRCLIQSLFAVFCFFVCYSFVCVVFFVVMCVASFLLFVCV